MNNKLINDKKIIVLVGIIFLIEEKSWNFLRFPESDPVLIRIWIRYSPIRVRGTGSGSKLYGSTSVSP